MLVACKNCHNEINKGVKVCPHCGVKNPGYEGNWTSYMVYLGYVLVVLGVLFTVADFLGLVSS